MSTIFTGTSAYLFNMHLFIAYYTQNSEQMCTHSICCCCRTQTRKPISFVSNDLCIQCVVSAIMANYYLILVRVLACLNQDAYVFKIYIYIARRVNC